MAPETAKTSTNPEDLVKRLLQVESMVDVVIETILQDSFRVMRARDREAERVKDEDSEDVTDDDAYNQANRFPVL